MTANEIPKLGQTIWRRDPSPVEAETQGNVALSSVWEVEQRSEE